MTLRIPTGFISVLFLHLLAHGQTIPTTGTPVPALASFDQVMQSLVAKYQVPGATLAVVKSGRLVFARGYGYSDRDALTPVQPDALFRIASVTKPHTAAAIMKLAEQGKLTLQDKAFTILNSLTALPGSTVDPRIANITVQNLLDHKSGWYGEADGTGYDPMFDTTNIAKAAAVAAPANCETIIRYMLGRPLDTNPGTYFSYSNFGYCVLGRIIQQLSGVPYDVYLKANVTGPIGSSNAALGGTLKSDRLPNEVVYYDYPNALLVTSVFPNGGLVPTPYGGFYMAAHNANGGLVTNTIELLRLLTSINGSRGPQLFQSPQSGFPGYIPPVGRGWSYIFHGSLPGNNSSLILNDDVAICYLTNTRPSGSSDAYFNDFDTQLTNAAKAVGSSSWPANDLFSQYTTSFVVTHAANYVAKALAPDEFVTIFGTNLSSQTASATTIPLPLMLGGTTVFLVDSSGQLFQVGLQYVSPGQINFVVPANARSGPAKLQNSNATVSANVWIDPVSPGLFTANSTGSGVPAANALRVTTTGSQVPENVYNCSNGTCTAAPLDLGSPTDQLILTLFGTGIAHNSGLSKVVVIFGSVNGTVQYAGSQGQFVGLDQMNVVVPRSLAGKGNVDVTVQVDGRITNTVTINVK